MKNVGFIFSFPRQNFFTHFSSGANLYPPLFQIYLFFRYSYTIENLFFLSSIAKNCAELYKSGRRVSGVYPIDPDGSGIFNVYCDQTTAGGGWTVIQKRMDGSVDFNRTWDDYKHGFGNMVGEFWLGLDKINRLTRNKTKNKLRVDLGVKTGKTVHPEYGWFGIGTETAKYRLYLGKIISKQTFFQHSPLDLYTLLLSHLNLDLKLHVVA